MLISSARILTRPFRFPSIQLPSISALPRPSLAVSRTIMSPAPTAPQDPPPKRSASPTSFCPEPKKPKPDPPKTEKRTPEEKVAHAAARQAAWMAANGITGVPEGPLPVSTSDLDFGRGLFLAPMVRSGTVVNRLLALQYGADLVWSPEVVDRAIIGSERLVDGTCSIFSPSLFLFPLM